MSAHRRTRTPTDMAHSLSAKKRIRQNEKSNARNRARKAQVRDAVKAVNAAIEAGDLDAAREKQRHADKVLSKVGSKRTIHPNTAARRRSRMAKRINKAAAEGAGTN